jgi:NAD(P)-dependent dehydrogenase (short-subunit alcohol dehydrogenase family)
MESSFSLDGQVALITGAGRGLGRQIAIALSEAGATVALTGRSEAPLRELQSILNRDGGRAATFEWDVKDLPRAEVVFKEVRESLGPVSILVNNAGYQFEAPAQDTDLDSWLEVINTNLSAVFASCRAFLRQGSPGSIINIASIGSAIGIRSQSAYTASKSGVVGLTRTLALEAAPLGIRVNALSPGYFRTEMPEQLLSDPARRDSLLRRIPLGRVADVHEIGPPVLFLASSASAYMTGAVLYFDGGYTSQ